MGKVLFSQMSVCPHTGGTGFFPRSFPGGTPVPGSFQGQWSQVLRGGGHPSPGLAGGGGYLSPPGVGGVPQDGVPT